jgi:prepilin-type processing-associated H-X9-DG protein
MRRGVTLAELCVVIGIIAALAGLLLPVIGIVRGVLGGTSCQHRLKQLGTACFAYSEQHGGLLPADRTFGDDDPATSPAWFHRLPPLMSEPGMRHAEALQCPSCPVPEASGRFANALPKSYKMNDRLDAHGRPRHTPLDRIRSPARTVLFADAVSGETGCGQWGHLPPSAVEPRHRGAANVLFADLSARAVPAPTQGSWLTALRWDP